MHSKFTYIFSCMYLQAEVKASLLGEDDVTSLFDEDSNCESALQDNVAVSQTPTENHTLLSSNMATPQHDEHPTHSARTPHE